MSSHKITATDQPVFPCWLYLTKFGSGWRNWSGHTPTPEDATHWHPDQPTAPTEVPTSNPSPFSEEGAHIAATRPKCEPLSDPASLAPSWAKRAAEEIASWANRLNSDGYCIGIEKEAVHAIILRHAPASPAESEDTRLLNALAAMRVVDRLSVVQCTSPTEEGTPNNLRSSIEAGIARAATKGGAE